MDTSETYIKMCEKAGEIQGEWKMSEWDYAYCRGCAAAIKESPWKDESAVIVLSGYETDGGYYGHEAEPGVECSCPVSNGAFRHGDRVFRDEHFWLPRQDQLQGMASSRPTPHSLAYTFGFFCEPIRCYRLHGTWVDNEDGGGIAQERELTNQPELEYPERFTSMEQLWLAFVMEKRYSKHWNGDDWIKVS